MEAVKEFSTDHEKHLKSAMDHLVTSGADEGFVVEPGDPVALAEHIVALIKDPDLRHSLGEGARRRAATFDVANTVARAEAVYEEVLT